MAPVHHGSTPKISATMTKVERTSIFKWLSNYGVANHALKGEALMNFKASKLKV